MYPAFLFRLSIFSRLISLSNFTFTSHGTILNTKHERIFQQRKFYITCKPYPAEIDRFLHNPDF